MAALDYDPGLLAAIIANPYDNVPRLALSDWLEEHGHTERAAVIRLQLELEGRQHGTDRHDNECECPVNWSTAAQSRVGCHKLKEQIKELLARNWPHWHNLPRLGWHLGNYDTRLPDHCAPALWFRGGFVGSIRSNTSDWLRHGPTILQRQPITALHFTGRVHVPHSNDSARVRLLLHGHWPVWAPFFAGPTHGWLGSEPFHAYNNERDARMALARAALFWARSRPQ